MNWELLLLLACPLMMLFCMKGMFSGGKEKHTSSNNVTQSSNQGSQSSEIQEIQIKMAELMEQNHELMSEMIEMKKAQGEGLILRAVKENSKRETS